MDTLLEEVDTAAEYVAAWCDGGYTTNLALEDVTEGKAWVVYEYDREPRTPSMEGRRGFWSRICTSGRARKWLRGLALMLDDEPGFWRPTATTTTATRG